MTTQKNQKFFFAVIFMSTQDAVKAEYLSRVRNIISGAAPLGATDEERFKKKANVFIGQGKRNIKFFVKNSSNGTINVLKISIHCEQVHKQFNHP